VTVGVRVPGFVMGSRVTTEWWAVFACRRPNQTPALAATSTTRARSKSLPAR
jgi:hypothetical protein